MRPAPGLLSTTTGSPSAWPSLSARTRVMTSVGPPAGNGTTIFTGFVGHACARHCGARTASAMDAKSRDSMGARSPEPGERQW